MNFRRSSQKDDTVKVFILSLDRILLRITIGLCVTVLIKLNNDIIG